MAPLTPHWQQPSHPDIQEVVIVNEADFTTKSLSRVALAPFALFARLDFPPCTEASEPTYATIFDTGNKIIIAGPKGLQPGDELSNGKWPSPSSASAARPPAAAPSTAPRR
ncbi:hypothetical protein LLEC1_03479 [Akanthomyces lecanii]|uniref:Uncharacterized protein n=1 Tax=Cordyceps confragosa TaxID=2714763 RepID=A0A179IBE1_CORDF|nr:hypothetical protein LLEC1_03479 [Akanthomyces lecanii]